MHFRDFLLETLLPFPLRGDDFDPLGQTDCLGIQRIGL